MNHLNSLQICPDWFIPLLKPEAAHVSSSHFGAHKKRQGWGRNAIGEDRDAGQMNAISVYIAFQSYEFSSIIHIQSIYKEYIYTYILYICIYIFIYEYVCKYGESVVSVRQEPSNDRTKAVFESSYDICFFLFRDWLQIQDILLKKYPDRLCRSEKNTDTRHPKTLCQRLPFGPFHSFTAIFLGSQMVASIFKREVQTTRKMLRRTGHLTWHLRLEFDIKFLTLGER